MCVARRDIAKIMAVVCIIGKVHSAGLQLTTTRKASETLRSHGARITSRVICSETMAIKLQWLAVNCQPKTVSRACWCDADDLWTQGCVLPRKQSKLPLEKVLFLPLRMRWFLGTLQPTSRVQSGVRI